MDSSREELPAANWPVRPHEGEVRWVFARGELALCWLSIGLLTDAYQEHDKIAQLLKNHFGITLETQEAAFKGWNWGVADFRGAWILYTDCVGLITFLAGQDLAFLVSDRTAFELPLDNVANSNIAGRTEVSLEFANLAGSSKGKLAGDEMVEIRFHVPGAASKAKDSDAGSQKSDNENEEEEISAAQAFHETIKDRANIGQITGNMILSFEEVLVLTPRGRYDMDMFPEFLRLRGKTYDYKILFSSINRLFLLPKDDQHVLFIVSMLIRPWLASDLTFQ
jgi:structure-specific recognition protein 1